MSGHVTWDGRQVPFEAGETLAQALTRHGLMHFGTGPDQRGRRVFCGIGQCQNCLVCIAGADVKEACLTPCEDGLIAGSIGDGT